jgi:dGTPase
VGELRTRRREERERLEDELLSPAATRSASSRGRSRDEDPDDYRTAFERDRDRIMHSKAFRRLKHKTQVFLNPEGDHYVTRLTHTMHVAQVGRAMAAGAGAQRAADRGDLSGHDVGHSPFGHTGEDALTPYVEGEWLHSAQGVRVLSVLEPLNLTWEVLDGVRVTPGRSTPTRHTRGRPVPLRRPDRLPHPRRRRRHPGRASSPSPTCPRVRAASSVTVLGSG